MDIDQQSQEATHPPTTIISLNIPINLTSLTLEYIDSNIELPIYLNNLTISFKDTIIDNKLHNPPQITNLHKLTRLTTLSLSGSNNIIDLSRYLFLKSLTLNCQNNPIINNEEVIKINHPHTGLRTLDLGNRNLTINPEFVPYLTTLDVNKCDKDINSLYFLEDLIIQENIGNKIELRNFKYLKHLDVGGPGLEFDGVKLSKLITMKVDRIYEINKLLYPKLEYCKIRGICCDEEEICNINHSKLLKLNITWSGKICLRYMDSLKVLKVKANDFDFLNDSECNFFSLKHLKLGYIGEIKDRAVRINLNKYPYLKRLIARWECVEITGNGKNLKEISVGRVYGDDKRGLVRKFKKLEELIVDGEEIDVSGLRLEILENE